MERGCGFGCRCRRERGMVSAELAAAFPVVIFALMLVLGLAQHAITASSAQEAARLAARAVARGESPSQAAALADRAAKGARVQISGDADLVRVQVHVRVRGPLAWLVRGGQFSGSATAAKEDVGDQSG